MEAKARYDKAVEEKDVEGMGKYARGFTKLNAEMINESKELLDAMGIATFQASGEGEMQAAELVKNGQAYAVGNGHSASHVPSWSWRPFRCRL